MEYEVGTVIAGKRGQSHQVHDSSSTSYLFDLEFRAHVVSHLSLQYIL